MIKLQEDAQKDARYEEALSDFDKYCMGKGITRKCNANDIYLSNSSKSGLSCGNCLRDVKQ